MVVTGAGESSCGAEQDTTMIAARQSPARRCQTVRMPHPNSPAASPRLLCASTTKRLNDRLSEYGSIEVAVPVHVTVRG